MNDGECACISNNGSKTDGPYLQPSQLTYHHWQSTTAHQSSVFFVFFSFMQTSSALYLSLKGYIPLVYLDLEKNKKTALLSALSTTYIQLCTGASYMITHRKL